MALFTVLLFGLIAHGARADVLQVDLQMSGKTSARVQDQVFQDGICEGPLFYGLFLRGKSTVGELRFGEKVKYDGKSQKIKIEKKSKFFGLRTSP